jgi:hypothetical protein
MPACTIVEYQSDGMVEFYAPHVTLIRECQTVTGTVVRSYVPSEYDQMDVPDWGWGMHVGFTLCLLVVASPLLLRKSIVK